MSRHNKESKFIIFHRNEQTHQIKKKKKKTK